MRSLTPRPGARYRFYPRAPSRTRDCATTKSSASTRKPWRAASCATPWRRRYWASPALAAASPPASPPTATSLLPTRGWTNIPTCAHARGVVHRDIKPGNIMLNGGGQAKIMDFGLARMRMADHKTSTGMVLGTPRYMSPEQISGQPVDQRSDIFSLGIVLYEMLTGTRLFAGEDIHQVQHLITQTEHVPPTRQVPGLPPMVDFVVARALKKDPTVRYQDARELAADLATCAAELRSRDPSEPSGEGSRTVKLEALSEKAPDAPPAHMIAVDTKLPVSRLFDATPALRRLKDASLGRMPRPVGLLRRLYRDAAVRQLFVAVVFAGAAGVVLALGRI